MRKALLLICAVAALVFVFTASASAPPSFAGTWDVDKAKSQNMSRIWQEAEGVTLVIVQNDKQVILETKIIGGPAPPTSGGGTGSGPRFGPGPMGPVTYNLDGTEANSESERGKSTTKATWGKDGTLELSLKRTFNTPNGEITATTTDKLSLSADGKVLTDVRHTESPRGPQDSTLIYNKKA
jgi:hypothetical protein